MPILAALAFHLVLSPGRDEAALEHVVALFSRADVVLLGESPHRGRASHELALSVVSHPDFGTRIQDVVVEFGTAREQATMDRFLLGLEDVPPGELARAWRDTTQLLVWDSPLYEAFFRHVRALNEGRPRERRLRVLLGDPPIDWEAVREPAELDPWLDREASLLAVLEHEVLAHDHKALVLIGDAHVMQRDARNGFAAELPRNPWLGQLLASRHPGRSRSVYAFFGRARLAGAADGKGWSTPEFLDAAADPLGTVSFGLVAPALSVQRVVDGVTTWVPLEAGEWAPVRGIVDALLYLGEDPEEVPPTLQQYRDEARVAELRRRAALLDAYFGFESYVPQVEDLVRAAGAAPR